MWTCRRVAYLDQFVVAPHLTSSDDTVSPCNAVSFVAAASTRAANTTVRDLGSPTTRARGAAGRGQQFARARYEYRAGRSLHKCTSFSARAPRARRAGRRPAARPTVRQPAARATRRADIHTMLDVVARVDAHIHAGGPLAAGGHRRTLIARSIARAGFQVDCLRGFLIDR